MILRGIFLLWVREAVLRNSRLALPFLNLRLNAIFVLLRLWASVKRNLGQDTTLLGGFQSVIQLLTSRAIVSHPLDSSLAGSCGSVSPLSGVPSGVPLVSS